MSRILMGLLVVVLALTVVPSTRAESITEAIKNGDVILNLRYRFEFVDEENFSEDAEASTLRLRLGYRTGDWYDIFALGEFAGTVAIGPDDYNSTSNGKTQFPVVPDPEDEEFNQAFVGYRGVERTLFKLGRQRINLDNQRFLGSVAWRQLEQTFDSFTATVEVLDNMEFFVGWLNNANTVFGEHNSNPALSDIGLDAPLINASFRFKVGTLVAYGYFFDFKDAPLLSNQNIGARFTGKAKLSDELSLVYAAELANQSDYKGGASIIDAEYFLGEVGVTFSKVTLKVGYEVLGGDGTYSFLTPFATLHRHNGWADRFLLTPTTGLEDLYISAAATLNGYKLIGVYHDFSADTGGFDYGTEIDLGVVKPFREIYAWGAKYAKYSSDLAPVGGPGPPDLSEFPTRDADKLWGWFEVKF
jgi:hypothetical protein